MRDDAGVAQLWTIRPDGGELRQLTHDPRPAASAFTWTPDGRDIAHVRGGAVCLANAETGELRCLTDPAAGSPRPEACVVSPDGTLVAFVRNLNASAGGFNQIFVCGSA